MPIALLVIGLLLVTAGMKGNATKVGAQIQADLLGSGGNVGFLSWFGAIFLLGILGYVPGFQKPARLLIILLIVVMVFKSDTGIFANLPQAFTQAEQAGPAPANPLPPPTIGSSAGGASSGGSSGGLGGLFGSLGNIGGSLGGIGDVLGDIGSFFGF